MKLFVPSIVAGAALLLNNADALNVKLHGVNYSVRKGPEWADDSTKCKTEEEVSKDLKVLATFTDKLRIDSMLDCNVSSVVLSAAKSAGFQVQLGIRVTKDQEQLQLEKTQLTTLIDSGLYDKYIVYALDVGSQSISGEEVDADLAIAQIKEVRELLQGRGLETPVTIAETIDTYVANPKLIDAVDFVNVVYFPIWERADGNEAASVTLDRLRTLRTTAAAANKTTEIAETGWSSGGSDPNAGIASPENQARYLSDMYQVYVTIGINFFWYTSQDQPWRAKEIESKFGLLTEDNVLKPDISQLEIRLLDRNYIANDDASLYLSESSSQLYMWEKSEERMVSEEQTWSWNPATQQLRCQSTFRCLDAYQPQDRGLVHMFRCLDDERNQKWTYDNVTNQLKHVSHVGFCLDVDKERSNRVQLLTCSDSSSTQKWRFIPSSTF